MKEITADSKKSLNILCGVKYGKVLTTSDTAIYARKYGLIKKYKAFVMFLYIKFAWPSKGFIVLVLSYYI